MALLFSTLSTAYINNLLWDRDEPTTIWGQKVKGIGVLQMNTVGVLQLLNFRRNIFV